MSRYSDIKYINNGLQRSMEHDPTTDKAMNVEIKVTRLGTLEVVSDETMNLGS